MTCVCRCRSDAVNVAIVHDWLTTLGGSELVLRELLRVYPDARCLHARRQDAG